MRFEDSLAQEVVKGLAIVDGQLQVPASLLASLERRIAAAADKQPFNVALIALAIRVKAMPASDPAVAQLQSLGATYQSSRAE